MKGMQKRWVVLAVGLALVSGLAIFPGMALADPVVEAGKSPFIPYWVAILAWLTAPITTAIFAYYKNVPFRMVIRYSSFIVILQVAFVAMIYLSIIQDTGMPAFLAFLMATIFPCIVMGYFAFKLADDLSKE